MCLNSGECWNVASQNEHSLICERHICKHCCESERWKPSERHEGWEMKGRKEKACKWKKAQAAKMVVEWWVSLRKVSCIVFIKKQKVLLKTEGFYCGCAEPCARASGLFCLFSLRAMHTASLENIFQLCTAASSIKILLNGIVYLWECHNYQQEITGISKCH